jgi:pyrimidine-nucleoside phosphorylase
MYLGAGRLSKEDFIDHSAGIIIYKKIGDFIESKEKLATLYYNKTEYLHQAVRLIDEAYTVEENKTPNFRLIHEVIH